MSMREIEQRFTKSELGIVAWRSQETSYQMNQKLKNVQQPGDSTTGRKNAMLPDGLPPQFFNKDGELDLRGVTGVEAWRFLQAQGMQIPMIPVQER